METPGLFEIHVGTKTIFLKMSSCIILHLNILDFSFANDNILKLISILPGALNSMVLSQI